MCINVSLRHRVPHLERNREHPPPGPKLDSYTAVPVRVRLKERRHSFNHRLPALCSQIPYETVLKSLKRS